MELNLIYAGTKCVFDINSNIVLSYIKELCTKIFPLKPKTFELFYNQENLKSYDDNTQLKEIIDNNENDNKISIYVKSFIPKKEKETNLILLPKDRNINSIKLKFDNFNRDYIKIAINLKDFKNNYQEKIDKIKDLINDFEINIINIDDRLNNYFNIKNYNKCLEIFKENIENLDEKELLNLNNLIETCIKDFKIIETQYKYENKIINYLNDFINQFEKIKKCSDNIQHMNDFKKTLTELDLLYSILFYSINKKVKNLSYNGRTNLSLNLKSENSIELPIIENDLNKTKYNTLEKENNLFKNYKNNVELMKKNKNHSLSKNFDRKSDIFPLSPKTHSIFHHQNSISRNKSRLKIRGLTKKLKLHLKKFFNNENNDNNITNASNEEENNNKKIDNNLNNDKDNINKNQNNTLPNLKNIKDNNNINNNEKKKEKYLNEGQLDLNSEISKNSINLNSNNINNNEEENNKKIKIPSLFINNNKKSTFKPRPNIYVDEKEKQELIEQLSKTLSSKKKKSRIENQIKDNSISKDEILTDDKFIENNILKKEIDLLKNEIEKLKNYNNILKNDIDYIKNNQILIKNPEIRNEDKKTTGKKNINLNDSFNKKSESSNLLTFNSKKLKSQIISKGILNEENKYNDSNDKNYQNKISTPIKDLSSKLLELTPSLKNKNDEEEIIFTPIEGKKISKDIKMDDLNFYDENNNPDLIYNGLKNDKIQNNNDNNINNYNNINYAIDNKLNDTQLNNYSRNDSKIENKPHKKKINKFDFII